MFNFDIIAEKTKEKSLKYNKTRSFFGKENLIPLWVADMDFPIGTFIQQDIINSISNHSLGYMYKGKEYYNAIINWQKKRFNLDLDKSNILSSNGVVFSMALIIRLFSKENDKIIVQSPIYPPFFKKVKMLDRQLVLNPLIIEENKYVMDYEQLEEQLKDAKLFFLCNPHNPVGRVWTRTELERLNNLCKKYNVLVVSDEIHSDLNLFGNVQTSYLTMDNDAIVLNAPSKSFNIASLNHSYILVKNNYYRRKIDAELIKMSLKESNYIGVTSLISAYTKGETWLDECKKYIENNYYFVRNFIEENLPKIKLYKFEGTYLLWLNFSLFNLEQKELMSIIVDKCNIALNNGSDFGVEGNGHLRMNLATNKETLKEALERIYQVFSSI